MTEATEADQDVSSINLQPNDEPLQTSNDIVDNESGKTARVTVTNEETTQEHNTISNETEKDSSENHTAVDGTDKMDEATNSYTKSTAESLEETQAGTGEDKETEPPTSQLLENRDEDGEESTTTEESSQSTSQVFVIQFANTEENTIEKSSVKVINTSGVETPEDDKTTAETAVVEVEKVPTAQESTPQEIPVTSEQEIAPVETSKESKSQITSEADSTDSNLPEDTKSNTESSSSDVAPKRLSRTVSFTIEATSKITREASIIVHNGDVVVSSSSSPSPTEPQNEQKSDQQDKQQSIENSDDVNDSQVIVNPETEEVSFRPRRRATSNTMFKASIIRNPAVLEETDDFNDEDFPQQRRPRPRVSTLSRFRSSFSFGPKDRTLSRSSASFVDKSKNNFLLFHDVGYTVQQKKYFRRLQPKVILKNIR